jgi:hypothetical protein
MLRFLAAALGLLWLVGALTSCANYRLGTGSAPTFGSVYVEPVTNRTLVPQAQAILSARIREGFLRDARVRPVNDGATAEARLTLVLTEYRRDIAAARESDTGLARKFNITLTALGTLRDQRSGKVLWENRPFTVMREVFTDGGQLQAEYEVIPLLADSLAQRIIHAALDSW